MATEGIPDVSGVRRDGTHGLRVGATPTVPSSLYIDAVNDRIAVKAAEAAPITSPYAGAPADVVAAIAAARDRLLPELETLSATLFGLHEEAFQEHESVRAIAALLAAHGIEAAVGVHDLPTAFVARLVDGVPAEPLTAAAWPRDAPRLAILAEYDALPGIGHGCGHNVIGSSSVGAFLAIAEAARTLPAAAIPGELVLIGTPAEEGGNGKEVLARRGAFEGVDAAIMAHPFGYDSIDHPFIGRRIVNVTYRGVPAHASATPFQGRNALDGVMLNYQAVGLLRQHLYPGDRIHANVTDGGQRPNIIPERASLQYYVRSELPETLRELSNRLDDIAHGAALATGTGVEVAWDPDPFTLPIRHNRALGERWAVHSATQGRRVYDATVSPAHLAASSDFGNVSQRLPGLHPVIKISPESVGLHTTEFAAYASGPEGRRGLHDGAYALAGVAADFLADPELRAGVRAEFERQGGAVEVEGFFDQ